MLAHQNLKIVRSSLLYQCVKCKKLFHTFFTHLANEPRSAITNESFSIPLTVFPTRPSVKTRLICAATVGALVTRRLCGSILARTRKYFEILFFNYFSIFDMVVIKKCVMIFYVLRNRLMGHELRIEWSRFDL